MDQNYIFKKFHQARTANRFWFEKNFEFEAMVTNHG